ncbi:TIGR02147 family protein [Fibrobacter sp.]|uniref:TIGR02147 family protein n=1 Tax=Fibrobacter sp. TaxID=35828 RepID=UPI0025B82D30|nr:TIGR02147 family protein [Fibrobacter sp.]MBR3071902.1 TIGR02147 family protein [Fibrobacter sp.]
MKTIFEYRDYREYVRDFYESRKKCSAFTWREFAKLAGFSSSGFLKLVCDGKTRLSKVGVEKVLHAMNLSDAQAEYFRAMVEFCDSQQPDVRRVSFERMMKIASENRVEFLEAKSFAYFSSWANPALRELAPIMKGATPLEMGHTLVPAISAAEARESLELQESLGLLKKDESGNYVQTSGGVSSSREVVSATVVNMQKQYAHLAADALERYSREYRHISGMTMGLDREAYERLAAELDAFRKKVAEIVSNVKSYDRVYRMNLQLFPLSKKVGDEK